MCAQDRWRKLVPPACDYERLTETGTILDLYGPSLHRLYEAVALSSTHRLELLPLSFFHSLARRLPGQVGLTLVYAGDRVAAFNWNLFDREVYHFLFAGLDYDLNPSLDLYFNLMYAEMDFAFAPARKRWFSARRRMTSKCGSVASQERRFFYVAPASHFGSLILQAAGEFLLPEPPRPATHHVFRVPAPVSPGRCR